MNTGMPDEVEQAWFAAVHRTMLQLWAKTNETESSEYWYGAAAGFRNMPPWSKRRWTVWAEQRAAAGDERFQLLFTRLAVLRMTQ